MRTTLKLRTLIASVIVTGVLHPVSASAEEGQSRPEPANSGFYFGVRPGVSFTETFFGFQGGVVGYDMSSRFTLLGGIDAIRGSFEDEEIKAVGALVMPSVVARYYVQPRQVGNTSLYLAGGLFLAIPIADYEEDGGESDSEEDMISDINEASTLGLNFALGAEYAVARSFSVGAEYGMRLGFVSGVVTNRSYDYDYERDDYVSDKDTADWSFSLFNTYATLTMNFRF